MNEHQQHIVDTAKHIGDGGAGLTYVASIVNIAIEIVNPLLTTIGLTLAIVWWVYRIRESRRLEKEHSNKKDKS